MSITVSTPPPERRRLDEPERSGLPPSPPPAPGSACGDVADVHPEAAASETATPAAGDGIDALRPDAGPHKLPQEPPAPGHYPPNQPPPPGYYPPPPGYYPPPPGYYPPPPPPGYYYNQHPPPGHYYYPPPPPPPAWDVSRNGRAFNVRGQPVQPVAPGPPGPPGGFGRPGAGHSGWDPPGGRDAEATCLNSSFDEPAVRAAFVRKVYTILSVQLAFTAAVVALFVFYEPLKEFVCLYPIATLPALGVFLVTYLALVCCVGLRRHFPCNFVLLTLLTASMSCVAGATSACYEVNAVMYTFVITTIVCVLVTFLAVVSPIDITGCGMVLCMMSLALFAFGIVATIVYLVFRTDILMVVYAGLAALMFSVFLMFDTQQIMGGRSVELSPEEYILGAIQLYVDIIMLFLNMLRLINCCYVSD